MADIEALRSVLRRLDGRGYPSYKQIVGTYPFQGGRLSIDHVQGDPFAAPSKVRVRLDEATAQWPGQLSRTRTRCVAFEDFLARRVKEAIGRLGKRSRGSGKSGRLSVDAGRQEILERTAVRVRSGWVEARLEAGLPAAGRRILGREAESLLCDEIPEVAMAALVFSDSAGNEAQRWVELAENYEAMQEQLRERQLVAFIADGSILPRKSGVSDEPLEPARAVAFKSPPSCRVELTVPNPTDSGAGTIAGMGIHEGVTLIVGGGYHGKSTVLRAIERAVYPHIPKDGREYVVARPGAVKIRAEDRRRIERVDISPFIRELPNGQPTETFSTEEASGSTSQAAAVLESVEAGADVLLMDEDTSATNLLLRDARMQALVSATHEPITPLLDRVRELYETLGVSTVMVMGGSGDYLDVADTVIMLREYETLEVTEEARRVAAELPSRRGRETVKPLERPPERMPAGGTADPRTMQGKLKVDAPAVDELRLGEETVDLRAVEQLVDRSQTRALGHALAFLSQEMIDGTCSIRQLLDVWEAAVSDASLDAFGFWNLKEAGLLLAGGKPVEESPHPGNLAMPRRHELAAALNRLRGGRR